MRFDRILFLLVALLLIIGAANSWTLFLRIVTAFTASLLLLSAVFRFVKVVKHER